MALGEVIGGAVNPTLSGKIGFPGESQGVIGGPIFKSGALGGKVTEFGAAFSSFFAIAGQGEMKNFGGLMSNLGAKSQLNLSVGGQAGAPTKFGMGQG